MTKQLIPARWLGVLRAGALFGRQPVAAQTTVQVLRETGAAKAVATVAPEPKKTAALPAAAAAATPSTAEVKAAGELVPKEDEIVTDRPDFTESSEVIASGGFQFESGANYEGDTREGVHGRSFAMPGALLRIGLGGRTELRIGGDGFLSQGFAVRGHLSGKR